MVIASCEFMFEETRNYVMQRKAFCKTVAHLQTVQHKLAELKTEICVGRAFLENCLDLHSVPAAPRRLGGICGLASSAYLQRNQ
ncbi:long-chain specific acyl-CoA dehydrogenase, mitochondrial-like [Oreochromis niloticus]|nr:long-chain specific acyl-CoA dehydrogenase, mitochondrial-like [Oreochromis niloticus]XP_031610861.1 long-chain specific acyl-CoA dehydrogenase, mitochondrial-like [Oreochromis aureus]